MVPGAGHLYLGIRDRGVRLLGAYLAIAVPTWIAFAIWGPVAALVGAAPALAVWVRAQRDLRRELGLQWPALPPTGPEALAAMRGHDRLRPAATFKGAPEDPRSRVPDGVGAWLDVAVTLVFAGLTLVATGVVVFGGGTPVEAALAFIVGAAATFQWAYTSYAWDKLRGRKDGWR